MKIAVAGTGYVGLVTGVCMAHVGNDVTCVDTNEEKINTLENGISPIYEPGLEELMEEARGKGLLHYTSDGASAYRGSDMIFIGVGTPEREDGSANLDYIYAVCEEIAESVEHDCIVVIKSTVPVGTNDKIDAFLNEKAKDGVHIEVVSNPEFLSQGTAVRDTLHASRIIIGTESEKASGLMKQVYEGYDAPKVVMSRKSAEMVKYASNDFLALKISFINEIANFCEIMGADIEDVTKGMSYDDRIGSRFLKAGLGYGGSCFPKDTKALHWMANDNDYEIKTIKATIEVNQNQKFKLFKRAKARFGTMRKKQVAILGLTFKPGTDDLREAPSIPNVRRLLEEGAIIRAYDPVGEANFRKLFSDGIKYCSSPEECIEGAEMAFIFTEWPEIYSLSPRDYRENMKVPAVFDGRNCYKREVFEGQGVEYYSIGRSPVTY